MVNEMDLASFAVQQMTIAHQSIKGVREHVAKILGFKGRKGFHKGLSDCFTENALGLLKFSLRVSEALPQNRHERSLIIISMELGS